MSAQTRSPSSAGGKVTITLTNQKDAENASVTVRLAEPEKVVERVVSELAKKFPPESVMTIDGGPASSDGEAPPRPLRARLTREEARAGRVQQAYVVSDELDIAIPIAPGDQEVQLASGAVLPVDPAKVYTCTYSHTGFLLDCIRGFAAAPTPAATAATAAPWPDKPGLGLFVQSLVVSPAFDAAVPIVSGQKLIHLEDGDLYSIQPDDVYHVFYANKGLAHFSRHALTGRLAPGIPDKPHIPAALVPMRVLADEALVMALSSAAKAILLADEKRVHVSLFDEQGAPLCYRTPDGGLVPGLPTACQGIPEALRYIYIPPARQRRAKPAQILKIGPFTGPSELADQTVLNPCLPQDIDVVLINQHSEEVAAFVSDRRPSLITGPTLNDLLPDYIQEIKVVKQPLERDMESASTTGSHERPRHRRGPAQQLYGNTDEGSVINLKNQLLLKARDASSSEKEEPRRRPARHHRKGSSTASSTSSSSSSSEHNISRKQAYFKPKDIDYAIPLAPHQSHVKLVSGDRIPVDLARTFVVAHDMRGLPLYTVFPDGRRESWALNQPGVSIKAQDYLVDSELLYAVPITPTQTEVLVNDGSIIEAHDDNVITVYYDASGRPAFSYVGKKRKIRPGLANHPGIASSVQYVWLIDCEDGSDEQFVVPVRGFQKRVQDPRNAKKTLRVDQSKLTVLFFDEHRQPLYTQLVDGALVSNGLTPVETSADDESSYQRVYNTSNANIASVYSEDGLQSVSMISGRRTTTGGRRGRDLGQAARGHDRQISTLESSSCRTQRKEVIERQVPVQRIEYRDKIVEVPEVHVVEKHVEVEKVEYQTKYVKKKQIVERPVEHVKYVPKIETKIVERVIEVPQIIEVERKEIIEQKINVDHFVDEKQEVVVANTLIPQIRDHATMLGGEVLEEEVECLRLEPELVPVDVYVPRLVHGKLRAAGTSDEVRKPVDVSLAHYNSLVLKMNPHLGENYDRLPLVKTAQGSFPMLNRDAKVSVHQPTDDEIKSFLQQTGFIASD